MKRFSPNISGFGDRCSKLQVSEVLAFGSNHFGQCKVPELEETRGGWRGAEGFGAKVLGCIFVAVGGSWLSPFSCFKGKPTGKPAFWGFKEATPAWETECSRQPAISAPTPPSESVLCLCCNHLGIKGQLGRGALNWDQLGRLWIPGG